MVRISDRIWNHVEKTDEVWKCRFCDHVFAKGIAAQFVKCHLAGVGGPGTKFCSDVPGHVKMKTRREINEGEKKRRIIMSTSPSSSSNVTVEVSPKNDGERMIEQETILRPRDGGVLERESDKEMIEAEFPAVMVKNGDSVCEICRDVFERRTPAKSMQWHLAEIGGSGDTICTSMPDDVKGAILQENTESKRKRRKTSSHTEDVPTMSIEDVAVQPLEAGWSGFTKALEDLPNEADHGVRDEKMVEVEDASVKDSREEDITGVPPGDLRQPTEKDHEQSGGFGGDDKDGDYKEEEDDDEEEVEEKKGDSNYKKGTTLSSRSTNQCITVPHCQVDNCSAKLSDAKDYHRRHKVCNFHSKSLHVLISGMHQRFCHQCSRFHGLAEFDGSKISCRKRLAGHNRHRKSRYEQSGGLKKEVEMHKDPSFDDAAQRGMAEITLHFNEESGKYKCNYCGYDFAPTSSTERLKAHLIGVRVLNIGTSTKICPNVPDEVRASLSQFFVPRVAKNFSVSNQRKTCYNLPPPPPSVLASFPNLPPIKTEGMTEATTSPPHRRETTSPPHSR